jgi:UDP-N-acetyl-D-glucosamine dehydrogenase
VLWGNGREVRGARILVVGVAYKPGIRDVRESPGVRILRELAGAGANVAYHDDFVPTLDLGDGLALLSAPTAEPGDYDLVVVVNTHPGADLRWLGRCGPVLDCTYRLRRERRALVA